MIRILYDNTEQRGDLDRTGSKNLVEDLDLETAALISIFTDRRADPSDQYGQAQHYKGGWWGSVTDGMGREMGSKLWLLRREKLTESNLKKAKNYLEDCLKWLVDDKVAAGVSVTTWRGVTPVHLRFKIEIEKPANYGTWSKSWEIQLDAL